MAETNAGNECPNDAKHPPDAPLVCANHRHKLDDVQGDLDDRGDDE
jgi:hypothetical protein